MTSTTTPVNIYTSRVLAKAAEGSRQGSASTLVDVPATISIIPKPQPVIKKPKDVEDPDDVLDFINRKLTNVTLEGQVKHAFDETVEDPNSIVNLFADPHQIRSLSFAIFRNDDFEVAMRALVKFRKYLSIDMTPGNVYANIDNVLQVEGIIERLDLFLQQTDRRELLYETCWVITNIAAGTTHHTKRVIPLLSRLIGLLHHPAYDVRVQAAWAVGNVAGDCQEFRDIVLGMSGVVEAIVNVMTDDDSVPVQDKHHGLLVGVWTISNLARWRDADWEKVVQFIPKLQQLLDAPHNNEVVAEVCWALSRVFHGINKQNRIQEYLNLPLVGHLLYYASLGDQEPGVANPALRALTNISSGEDNETDMLLHSGAISTFKTLISTSSSSITLEVLMCISNIAAGTKDQCRALWNGGIIEQLIRLLGVCLGDVSALERLDWKVVKESVWSLSNAVAHKIPEINQELYTNTNIMECLMKYLQTCPIDSTSFTKAIDLIYTLLTGNEPDVNLRFLQRLQNHTAQSAFANIQARWGRLAASNPASYALEEARKQLEFLVNRVVGKSIATELGVRQQSAEMDNLVDSIVFGIGSLGIAN